MWIPTRCRRPLALATALLALAACSATPTPDPGTAQPPTFTGISVASTDHSVAVRDLFIPDPGPAGYPAGISVPLAVQVWNNTNASLSLTGAAVAGGRPAALIDGRSTATAATTFELPIRAGASIGLDQRSGRFLQVQCAGRALIAGTDLPMTFTFSNGATITVDVPIGRFPDSSAATAGTAC